MSNKLEDLKPEIKEKAKQAIELMQKDLRLKNLGVIGIGISETKRELSVQMAYYSRSRMQPDDVVKMYKAAGLYTPSLTECKTANTWTLDSKHIQGLAIDLVPIKAGAFWWSAPKDIWMIMGEIGKSCGLKWGGDWKNTDCPHFEV